MSHEPTDDGPLDKPQRRSVFARLALDATGTERQVGLRARIDDPSHPLPDHEWDADLRMAMNFGLVTVAGTGDDRTVARTEFGDAWAALDRSAKRDGPWCLPGPGRFDVLFYPVTKHPGFPVFAASGTTVQAVRQGGWNLAGGFSGPEPNPVSEVEMIGVREDGTTVSAWSGLGDPVLTGLHLANRRNGTVILDRLAAALAEKAAPWVVRPVMADGVRHEALVLDLHSKKLPEEVVGPPLLAVADVDGATVTVISDAPADDLTLTRIDPVDLLGAPPPG